MALNVIRVFNLDPIQKVRPQFIVEVIVMEETRTLQSNKNIK